MLTSDIFQHTQKGSSHFFEDHVHNLLAKTLDSFRRITRGYAVFHMSFFLVGVSELLGLLLFFPFFAKTALVAYSLAALFLTGFAYFILRFYLDAKKPEQLLKLKENFVAACVQFNKEESVVPIVYQFLGNLEGQEYQYYQASHYFKTLQPLFAKLSLWCHWKDVHQMKELLHFYCIQHYIEWIKQMPIDPEAHSALGQGYVALYKLYIDPQKLGKKIPYTFITKEYQSSLMLEKFEKAAARALEEFKILDAYVPHNLWVHSQLAAIYHDLQMSEKEIAEYEMLRQMAPDDRDVLFKLGILYFEQGRNAQGLKIYEELRKVNDSHASSLMHFYDARIEE